MSQKKTLVISDIHMGTNTGTNWYQREIHEGHLAFLLNWIIRNPAEVNELIILGDLFDYWTCAPDEPPPTAAEIIDANPNILSPTGLLSQVLTALNGNVSYLRGNHDISTTQEDLDEIKNPTYKIQMRPDIYTPEGERVVYTHGHLYTMFNAPDIRKRPLPVGHFVTRAIAYKIKEDLKKSGGKRASELAGFGVDGMMADFVLEKLPNPLAENEFAYAIRMINILRNTDKTDSIAVQMLDFIQKRTKIPDHLPIILERGQEPTTFAQAKIDYANLCSDWIAENGGHQGDDLKGGMFAYKAINADADGDYLGWFAQQLAFKLNADLVVMGHTHTPKKGLEGDLANYINNGFDCGPVPDMDSGKAHMTHSIITTENGRLVEANVFAITKQQDGSYRSSNLNPPKAPLVGHIAADYGCYITVENTSDETYIRGSIKSPYGYFVIFPPETIPPKTTVKFWIQDPPGPFGSDGEVHYRSEKSGDDVLLVFRCTTTNAGNTNPNICGGTNEFHTQSGSFDEKKWGGTNIIAESGNPFFVKFVLSAPNRNEFYQNGKNLVAGAGRVLKVGEQVTVNGSTDLSGIITGVDGATIYSIRIEKASKSIDTHTIIVDGKGPKGWSLKYQGIFWIYFTDQSGDTYSLSLIDSDRKTHTVGFRSNSPYIKQISWKG